MSTPKSSAAVVAGDRVLSALDNALPLESPLSEEEALAVEEAMREDGPALTSEELMERLRSGR